MKIIFVSNYINHHQIPLSDKLYELSNGDYAFIQTEPIEEERIKLGWDVNAINKPYVKFFYEAEDECKNLILDSDCVIFGGTEMQELIIPRLEAKKFTIRYSERLYKDGRWKFISPRGLKRKYYDHTRFNNYPVYLLCAGAYVKGDFALIHAYKNKAYKFGYFPRTEIYEDIDELRNDNQKTEILWVGRYIDWKHPEVILTLASDLLRKNYDFHLTMVGNGELLTHIKGLAKSMKVDKNISFVENASPDDVRLMMRKADLFISTSDQKEGWGAVINEAMNSGCVVVAPKEIGSAPYLIKNGENGLLYSACNKKQLLNTLMLILSDEALAIKLRRNAYNTIVGTWNADIAAERLYKFINKEKLDYYEDGPLSKA